MHKIDIFTDGACSGNPGPGGWGAILRATEKGRYKEISGGQLDTTNNQMEMLGVISALESLKTPCDVTVTTDSKYVIQGMTEWLQGWKARGWKTASKQPVKNVELWKRLEAACKPHTITWVWVKGHDGHPDNERADALAVAARIAIAKGQ